jgi:hypothetical protein
MHVQGEFISKRIADLLIFFPPIKIFQARRNARAKFRIFYETQNLFHPILRGVLLRIRGDGLAVAGSGGLREGLERRRK